MPLLKKAVQQPGRHPPQEQEGEGLRTEQPAPVPVEAEPMEPGRPYKAFVENEAREYWQSIGAVRNLTKPTQQEIREAALPVLCHALRSRTGSKAHHAIAAIVQHARERDWTSRSLSDAGDSPSYIDALIQLGRDMSWLIEEVWLPDHPPIRCSQDFRTNEPVPPESFIQDEKVCLPDHPPIYYTRDAHTNEPVPIGSVIHGEYLCHLFGPELSRCNIRPWESSQRFPEPDGKKLADMGLFACYTLTGMEEPSVMIHYHRAGQLRYQHNACGGGWTMDYSSQLRSEPLKNLRAASMKLATLKESDLDDTSIKAVIKAIRRQYDLVEPDFPRS